MKVEHWNNEKQEFELVEVKRIYLPKRPRQKHIREEEKHEDKKMERENQRI